MVQVPEPDFLSRNGPLADPNARRVQLEPLAFEKALQTHANEIFHWTLGCGLLR